MDAVKTFFAVNKSAFANGKQQLGFGGQTANGSTNSVTSGNSDGKIVHDMKRKDSDSYFYIMWRS